MNMNTIDHLIDAILKKIKQKNVKKKKKIEIINENSYAMNKNSWIQCMKWLQEFTDKNMNIIVKKNYKSMKENRELLLIY